MVELLVFALAASATPAFAANSRAGAGPAQIAAGRAIYERSCAFCHGAHGEGAPAWQQPDAQGEMPAPPHDASGHTWKHSDAMLYQLIQHGWRDPFNRTQRLTMPAFEGQLSRADTMAVIAFLKTLWTPDERRFQTEESRRAPFPSTMP